MTKMFIKSNHQYKCNECDKPYIKRGALTNHLKKVHNLPTSPTKKEFMDISNNSDSDDELDTENSVLLEHAKDLDRKDDAEELDVMLGMKSTVTFDATILNQADKSEKSVKVLTTSSNPGKGITIEPLTSVPLCSPAAKFLSESQKKILIPDPQQPEDEEVNVTKTTYKKYTCGQCKKAFTNIDERNKHIRLTHVTDNNSAGDHKCPECSYRTNFAANYLLHMLNTHSSNEFTRTVKSLKPVDSALVYMLAEQNMALAVESKLMRKDLDYIKEVLRPKSPATRFTCQKCKDVCASRTRMQEHMLEDHCCKYCDKVFASKTEKERHKKYMCVKCELTFSHSVELNIHHRTFHQETLQVPQFHCTECSHEENTEEDIVKHIETKHPTILSPAKISQPIPAPRRREPNVTINVEEDHVDKPHSETSNNGERKMLKCFKCDHH